MSTGFADRLAARAGSRTFPPRCQFTSSLIRNWSAHGDSTGKRHSCRFSKRRPPLPQSPSNAASFCRDCPVARGVDSVLKRQDCRFPVGGLPALNGDARSPMNAPWCQYARARHDKRHSASLGLEIVLNPNRRKASFFSSQTAGFVSFSSSRRVRS